MEGRRLTKSVFHCGKGLYRLMACACRTSVPKVSCLGNVGNVEILHGNCGLGNRILLVKKVQPICQHRGSWMSHEDIRPCDPSIVLQIQEMILRTTRYIGELLWPVTLQTVLRVLNPFGHPWNTLQDEDSESESQSQDEGPNKPWDVLL